MIQGLADSLRGALWPIMSFYSELETEAQHGGSTEAAEWLETLRWSLGLSRIVNVTKHHLVGVWGRQVLC